MTPLVEELIATEARAKEIRDKLELRFDGLVVRLGGDGVMLSDAEGDCVYIASERLRPVCEHISKLMGWELK